MNAIGFFVEHERHLELWQNLATVFQVRAYAIGLTGVYGSFVGVDEIGGLPADAPWVVMSPDAKVELANYEHRPSALYLFGKDGGGVQVDRPADYVSIGAGAQLHAVSAAAILLRHLWQSR